jgi:hypothetical protein
MKLKKVGFFRELRHGDPDGPSLRSSVSGSAHADELSILQYLTAGEVLVVIPSIVGNIRHPDSTEKVSISILTDGIWAWPNDLQLYVKDDHVRLPEPFVAHMRANRWSVPELTTSEIAQMEL